MILSKVFSCFFSFRKNSNLAVFFFSTFSIVFKRRRQGFVSFRIVLFTGAFYEGSLKLYLNAGLKKSLKSRSFVSLCSFMEVCLEMRYELPYSACSGKLTIVLFSHIRNHFHPSSTRRHQMHACHREQYPSNGPSRQKKNTDLNNR